MMKRQSDLCEEEAFKSVYTENSQRLVNFLFYNFGDLEQARNFSQDAFIRLWKNCKEVALDKAKGFLYTTAKRLFLDEIAHEKVVLKFQDRTKAKNEQAETADDLLRTSEFKKALEDAISQLPEKQRTVFLMNRIDKMKYAEISEALEISVKTVEKHMSQSLIKVRKALSEFGSFKF